MLVELCKSCNKVRNIPTYTPDKARACRKDADEHHAVKQADEHIECDAEADRLHQHVVENTVDEKVFYAVFFKALDLFLGIFISLACQQIVRAADSHLLGIVGKMVNAVDVALLAVEGLALLLSSV